MGRPLVSIIIPTKNAAWCLQRCLESVGAQTYPAIEIIVVDNFSKDETRAIAKRFTKNVLTVGPERTAQMNAGIARATGTYVYEIAADFTLDPDLVERAVDLMEREGLDAVVTHVLAAGDHFWARVRALERLAYLDERLTNAARFFKKAAIVAIGGFDERLVAAEDYDVQNRLLAAGYRVGRLTGSYEHHFGEPRSIGEIAKKNYYYGSTLLPYIRKYPLKAFVQLLPIRPSFFRQWRLFVRQPLLTLAFLLHQLVKYLAAVVGIVVWSVKRILLGPLPRPLPHFRTYRGPERLVSVIVPTKNAARTIKACLDSIRRQSYGRIELVVVDNSSTDRTAEIAGATADRVLIAGPERSAQRNLGAKNAKGEFLLFIDADMRLTPDVVSGCLAAHEATGEDATMIPEQDVSGGFWTKVKTLEKVCYYGDDLVEAARFFTRESFSSVGGYDESLVASEDWDLTLRLRQAGRSVGRTDQIIFHDEGRLTLWGDLKKKFYYGRNLRRYIAKHPDLALRQLQPFRAAFWRNRRFLLGDPVHAVGILCLRVLESIVGVAGVLTSLLKPAVPTPKAQPR